MDIKTPLYERHISLGGKITPYAGYLLPVQYEGVIPEHMAVREKAGMFDVSHMGEIIISGPDALKSLNYIFTNDFSNMADGRARYTLLCNEKGGIADDMIIYRLSKDRYMAVPNAANRQKAVDIISGGLAGDVKLEDVSESFAQIALQGPKSHDILAKVTAEKHIPAKYYGFIDKAPTASVSCLISRTGYTGEPGYELYCPSHEAVRIWDALMEAGEPYGLAPCGLGARDTLRLETGMPLYGHEMDDETTPFETGLGFAVKMTKPDFIGKKALLSKDAPQIKRVGLKVTGKGIIRENSLVYYSGEQIGKTTSGTYLPYLQGAYAMALVESAGTEEGAIVEAEVRGRRIQAEIVKLPFYKHK